MSSRGEGSAGFSVHGGFLPSFNFDLPSFVTLDQWYERRDLGRLVWFPLGGLKMRPEAEMRAWLKERQELGLRGVTASFVGTHAVHDRWNGRRGDFEFLLQTLRTATEIGLDYGTTLFLTKSSLPLLNELVEILGTLPPSRSHPEHHVRIFCYVGHAAHHDHDRITESDRDEVPELVVISTVRFTRTARSVPEDHSRVRGPMNGLRAAICMREYIVGPC